jgi:dolichyl-phosphate beta-glucosyltransferase
MKQPDLTIVIPALHEESRIGKTLDDLARFLQTDSSLKTKRVEVLVVAADTTDKTHMIAVSKKSKFNNFRLLKPGPPIGKGRDVQFGMLAAKGKAILFMDADLATPLYYLPIFYDAFQAGNDVVIGSRDLRKHHPGMQRRIVSNIGNILFKVAGGVWIEDSQCGFKLFSHKATDLCFSKMTIMGWGFDMEVLAIAEANKLHILPIRIKEWVDKPDSTFTENIVKVSLQSMVDLVRIAQRRMSGYYISNKRE